MNRSDFAAKDAPSRPRTPPVIDADSIPEEIRALDQWVVWRRRHRDDKSTKVPYQSLAPTRLAETNDHETWSSFADAVIATCDVKNGLDGVGFVFTADDPYCGLDLDRCLDDKGRPLPWAQAILDRLPGYAEVSPSGLGLKLFLNAEVPGKRHKLSKLGDGTGALECYDQGRYFTATGRVLGHDHARIVPAQAELNALYAEWFPAPIPPEDEPRRTPQIPAMLDDRQLFDKASQARNGAKFTQLYAGRLDGYPSKSEADLALCSCLSFYTQDPATIERMFGLSGLVSEKWTSRPDYRELTINKALERTTTYGANRTYLGSREKTYNTKYSPDAPPENGEGGDISYIKYSQSYREKYTPGARDGENPAWSPSRLEKSEPASAFPLACLPGPLADLVSTAAASLGCPVDFPAVAALAVASGAMGRSVALTVKDGWVEAPGLYMALVGDPGMTKSPAVAMLASPLWKITGEQLEHHRREVEQAGKGKDKDREATAQPKRIVVDDVTTERLAGLLAENPRGVVMVKDELSSLFSGMNQYKAGGKGADRQFFLSAWSGSSLAVDRKNGAVPVNISHPFLSIVGGMTPGMLGEMGEGKGRDDGFLDRFLFTSPESIPVRWTDGGVPPELALDWEHAVRRLWSHGMTQGVDGKPRPWFVRFTAEARDGYAAWYDAHNEETEGDDFPAHLKGPWAKMRAYCARLALLMDRLGRSFDDDGLDVTEPVGVESLSRAIVLLDYFKSHTRRVRSMMGGTFGECPDARILLGWIRRTGKSPFGVAEVRNNFRKRFPPESGSLEAALRWLEQRHAIRPYHPPAATGPGRPRSAEYEVNPDLLGDMAGGD